MSIGIFASSDGGGGGGGGSFSPDDVSGLAAWYDVSTITGLSNGDPVSSLTDLSGNGITLTSVGTTTYRTNITGLNPCVYFATSGSDYFIASSASDLDLTGDFYVAGVFYIEDLSDARNALLSKDSERWEISEAGEELWGYVGNQGISGGTISAGGIYLVSMRRTSSSSFTLRLDGSQVASTTTTAYNTGFRAFRIGMRPGDPDSAGLVGGFAEAVIYNTDVSSSNVTAIESYLTTKWGL